MPVQAKMYVQAKSTVSPIEHLYVGGRAFTAKRILLARNVVLEEDPGSSRAAR